MRREWLSERFSPHKFPDWPCPRCARGRLRRPQGETHALLALPSRLALRSEGQTWLESQPDIHWGRENELDGDGAWAIYELVCTELECRTGAVVVGVLLEENAWDPADVPLRTHAEPAWGSFIPMFVDPCPDFVPLPLGAPRSFAIAMRRSFRLFWADRASSATFVRIAVEHLLDGWQVPRSGTEGGSIRLHNRLAHHLTAPLRPHQEKLLAVKVLGNDGAHEVGAVSWIDLVKAYDVVQEVLLDLYHDYPATDVWVRQRGSK